MLKIRIGGVDFGDASRRTSELNSAAGIAMLNFGITVFASSSARRKIGLRVLGNGIAG
jgi:hypothetical protein